MRREDNIKTRLTDRDQLLLAVQKLIAHGVPEELIPARLARAFYVDMDELNFVLQMVRAARRDSGEDRGEPYQAVA
ncbi:hypothetical protein [Chelativorans sp.]|uniref:hypothetical protein n=1 Tax=Chelativorans sp. TaxID=2203393 RepID=UPI002812691C|nr:hypothetical protein [Chelativorans sp.]